MFIYSFKLELGNSGVIQRVQVVTERTKNDVNGNPIYLVTVLMVDKDYNGYQWSPEELDITRKDGKLRIQSYLGHAGLAQQVFDKLQAYYKEEAQ